ncbi:MAG: TolC family protein [Acidobacteriota bacterium]
MSFPSTLLARFGLTLLGLYGVGCASVDPRPSFDSVRALTASRLGAEVGWRQDHDALATANRRVGEILAAPLSADGAVEVALLRNPRLQARLEELGIAQADLAQASLLANPHLSVARLDAQGSASGRQTTLALEIQVLDWLVQPLRRRMAERDLERVRFEIGHAILETAAEARNALVETEAAEQLIGRLQLIAEIDRTAAEFSEKLFDAGNLGALELAQSRAAWAQTQADIAMAKAEARRLRERVNRALGLFGEDIAWTSPTELPELPPTEVDLSGLESLAMRQRLDLAAGRSAVDAIGKALALKKGTRFFPVGIDLGVETEKELDGVRITGPTLKLQIPIFDTGRASVARLESQLRQARWMLEAMAVDARSEVREKRDDLIAARDRTSFFSEALLPLRAQILDLTLRHYNMMLRGTYDVLLARQREVEAERGYIMALRDYWLARGALERAAAGRLDAPGKEVN